MRSGPEGSCHVVWPNLEVVAVQPHRHAGIRVMLDGEADHWGFNYNELEASGGD